MLSDSSDPSDSLYGSSLQEADFQPETHVQHAHLTVNGRMERGSDVECKAERSDEEMVRT